MGIVDGFRNWLGSGGSVEHRIKEAVGAKEAELREQFWTGAIADPDLNLTATQGGSLYFNRLSQTTRELAAVQQNRATELAYLLYESNPMGKAIVEIPRDFILGDSVNVSSVDQNKARRAEQQDIIDAFWNDPINLMDLKLHQKVMELGLFGEQCWPVTVNDVNGHVQLGYIDPANIKGIQTDPFNVEKIIAVVAEFNNDENVPTEHWYSVVTPIDDPNSEWYGRLKVDNEGDSVSWKGIDGKTNTRTVKGSCFFYTVNKVTNSTRGKTDLLSLIDWIDAYDQLLFGEVDRGLLMKAFIWDVKLSGYTDRQIDDYRKANPQPKPASVRYHNDKVEWNAVTPDLKSADASEGANLILSYIATGARLPKTWINGGIDVNRATAKELSTPSIARLVARQKYVKYIIDQMVTLVLDQAEMKGRIKKRPSRPGDARPPEWSINIALPNLDQKEKTATADVLLKIVTAVTSAKAEHLIDADLAQELIAMVVQDMGIEVDLQAMRDRIVQEQEQEAAQVASLAPTGDNSGAQPAGGGTTNGASGGAAGGVTLSVNGKPFNSNENPEAVLNRV